MNYPQMRCDCWNHLVRHAVEGRDLRGVHDLSLKSPYKRGQSRVGRLRDRIGNRRDCFDVHSHVLSVRVVEYLGDVKHRGSFFRHIRADRKTEASRVHNHRPCGSWGHQTSDTDESSQCGVDRPFGRSSGKPVEKWIFWNAGPQMLQQCTEPTADRPPLCFPVSGPLLHTRNIELITNRSLRFVSNQVLVLEAGSGARVMPEFQM